jgi:hypothetical protein
MLAMLCGVLNGGKNEGGKKGRGGRKEGIVGRVSNTLVHRRETPKCCSDGMFEVPPHSSSPGDDTAARKNGSDEEHETGRGVR